MKRWILFLFMVLFTVALAINNEQHKKKKELNNNNQQQQQKREILNNLDEDTSSSDVTDEKETQQQQQQQQLKYNKQLIQTLLKLQQQQQSEKDLNDDHNKKKKDSESLLLELQQDSSSSTMNEDEDEQEYGTDQLVIEISLEELIDRVHDSEGSGDVYEELKKMVGEAQNKKTLDQLLSQSTPTAATTAATTTTTSPTTASPLTDPIQKQKEKQELDQTLQFMHNKMFGFEDKSFLFSPTNRQSDKIPSPIEKTQFSLLPGHEQFILGQQKRGFNLIAQSSEKDTFQYVGSENIDIEQSIQLLTESANLGNHKAMYILGTMEEMGEIGFINFTKAVEWYQKSAGFGNPEAQYSLAFLYSTGKGVEMNEAKSILYLTFAARSGHIVSKLVLGYRYFYGHGAPKSCQKAAQLYEEVAKYVVDEHESKGFLHQLEVERFSDRQQHMKSSQPEEESVVDFFKYSALSGDVHSLVTMANLYLQGGFGVAQDLQVAFNYYREAAQRQYPQGMAGLGFMYSKGYGIEQSNETAVFYYKRAADLGNVGAKTNLGEMYLNGWGVSQNVKIALNLFTEAANSEDPEAVGAQIQLGKMYLSGQYIAKDLGKALGLFQAAATQGNLVAIYYYASLSLAQQPTPTYCQSAVLHFKRVAERGPWSQILTQAQQLFDQGDDERALLFFEKGAEMGIEIAQNNAAWMYDQMANEDYHHNNNENNDNNENNQNNSNSNNNIPIDQEIIMIDKMVFRYYSHSAEQNNPIAHLKLGDYYYYGRGEEPIDQERAADLYQQAAHLQNAQALFNLGYIHQFGLGRQQDLFLAKRYYDMALMYEPSAYIPVYLAMSSLWAQYYYRFIASYLYGVHDPLLDQNTNHQTILINNDKVVGNDDRSVNYDRLKKQSQTIEEEDDESFDFFSVDSYLICIVAIIFCYLVVRRQRLLLRQNQRQPPPQQN
ncbi:hypothetical protein DFA_02713 [Cavenderia fasciculata]|uniref:Uncharacterized protein n=1 Tax=Cavenderia fasciculata TaxID=261658 RepID=F4PHY3_CACFS|nr:uncharacterized protein DFA_02713 [Cavenderia fasciculata]EGG24470.1 hypothetical protein DFA_02713 [Cavenderia fasciculata]|eukprot:XP_004362321.1 hypothetical protein DFA_02713 [Cavenderia fasciculata]